MRNKEIFNEIKFTGIQVYYYFIDPKRLWYFSHYITMEHESDLIQIGKLITNESFKRDKKEIQIGRIKIDFIRKYLEVHEVKKSSKFKEASRWQIIYYLWVLKRFGIKCTGILNFLKERKIERVELTKEKEKELIRVLKDIKRIVNLPTPPSSRVCYKLKKSPYFELFFA